jgi:hypothetical protein
MAAGTGPILGNGTTFVLTSPSGTVGLIVSIDPEEESITDVPDDNLATVDVHELIPGKLTSITPMKLVCVFDPDSVPPTKTLYTGTVTYPVRTGQTVPGTRFGTGYINRRKVTSIENDTRVLVELDFQWDGKTGPSYTPGS